MILGEKSDQQSYLTLDPGTYDNRCWDSVCHGPLCLWTSDGATDASLVTGDCFVTWTFLADRSPLQITASHVWMARSMRKPLTKVSVLSGLWLPQLTHWLTLFFTSDPCRTF